MTPFFLTFIQVAVVLVFAPLGFGLIRYEKARLVGRKGIAPYQPYLSLAKYLRKENLIPPTSSWVFRAAPYLFLALNIMLAALLPLITTEGILGSMSHFLVILGILGMSAAVLAFGAIDAGGVTGGMGAARQMLVTALSEPTFILTFAAFGVATGQSTLGGMVGAGLTILDEPALVLVILAFMLVALAENDRYPVDNPETSLELTMIREAMGLNYSGPYLAMIDYAAMVKFVVFALLSANFLLPFPLLSVHTSILGTCIVFLATALKLMVICGAIALLETTIAKMRFYRIQEYLSGAFFLSLAGFVLTLIAERL